jgi:ABC-type transporter Mla subunit MlaD
MLTISLQLRAVDVLSAQEIANRKGLAEVTIELQTISKDVNKLISDIDVASRNLAKMQEALTRLDNACSTTSSVPSTHRQQLVDTLQYLYSSMDKQKMWLHNYRDRKDIAMSLVFNLVTQQDAANNIGVAKGMKRDSSSMNGIALLTMIFLPGTFTSVRSSFLRV